jgi:hypothetical protein
MMLNNEYRQQLTSGTEELGRFSPDTIRGYVGLSTAGQRKNLLGAKMRESIALAVAVTVRCEYSAPARQAYARLSKIAESKPAFRRRNNCAVAGIQQDPGSPGHGSRHAGLLTSLALGRSSAWC